MTTRQIELLAQKEARELPSIDTAELVEIQNDLMKDVFAAEKRARASKGAPRSLQQLARESQEFAIARAEEFFALDMEAF